MERPEQQPASARPGRGREAFVGMRPAEMYGLRWADVDLRAEEVHVHRQYSPRTRSFEPPKNGRTRTIVLTPPPQKLPCSTFRARSTPKS